MQPSRSKATFIGALGVLLCAEMSAPSPASAATPTVLYASPSGSGSTCSLSAPCSLDGVKSAVEGLAPAMAFDKSRIIATFALCGFANFSSIAIQIGGIGALAPERRGDLARLGLKAMIAGTLANFLSAAVAGVLL